MWVLLLTILSYCTCSAMTRIKVINHFYYLMGVIWLFPMDVSFIEGSSLEAIVAVKVGTLV